MAHGRFDADEGGAVALLDDELDAARWVDDRLFADLIAQGRTVPRLFVLHLCEGGAVDFDESFAGVAPQLIRTLVPAVVAMQYPITNGAAARFIKAFYGHIAAGQSVDDAAQRARFTLSISGGSGVAWQDFGIPVIYLRSRDAVLDPAPAPAAAEPGMV
jgi:CHAT domain-containing protein